MNYQEKAQIWHNNKELDETLKKELSKLTEQELKEAFTEDLEFGTGGLRGILGAGTNRINLYTIRKAALGFGQYLRELPNAFQKGVVISYDNRHYSAIFSLESAKVLASLGFKVYLFSALRPTPQLSFTVRHLKAIGGIMITASHNPKEYNGFKIYDENGCQLIPELADKVIEKITKINDIFNIETNLNPDNIIYLNEEMDQPYFEMLKTIPLRQNLDKNFKIIYTPLHGTGSAYATKVLKNYGYNVIPVEEQMIPDPNFSCVSSSNPEEEKAYIEAIKLAKKQKADLILATDPDADRLGVCCLHQNDYVLLNGNQTATLMIHYILNYYKQENKLPENGYIFSTNVSSDLPLQIAQKFGLKTKITLTGFKFIGDQAQKIAKKGVYMYGYEESYGCLIKDFVRDKDAIQAIMMASEITAYYHSLGLSLIDALDLIYKEYGYYLESISNISLKGLSGKEKINNIMNYFRANELILDNISQKEDNLTGMNTIYEKDRIITAKSDLPKSNVIKYILKDKTWFVLRPSGTEPKLKVYYGVVGKSKHDAEKKLNEIKDSVLKIVNTI